LTISLYYRDPDDNGVELSIDNVELAQWHDWMREQLGRNPIDVPLDPMISRRSITRVSQRPNFVDSSPSRSN